MRFLNIMTAADPSANITPPDPVHMAAMNKSIKEAVSAGAMLATGGLGKRVSSAARVISKGGKITVEDPPASNGGGDSWMAGSGYALTESASKEEAIAQAKETLGMMGSDGMLELIQVSEMYPPARQPGMPPMNGVIPYLAVEGADEAGKLYAEAFGATEHRRASAQDGKRLMHLHLSINGGSLMMSDVFPEFGHPHQPSNCFTMTLVVADGQMWWDRAVNAGLEIVSPYRKEMWGDNYGQLKDRFGVVWAISSPAA